MKALKSGLIAIALVVGLSGTARAQFVTGGFGGAGTSAYPAYGTGTSSGYYTVNSGFGNYGLPGTNPGFSGFGLPGYGPGANLGAYFPQIQPNRAPQTTNNMGGLMNTIRSQTGAGNSYGSGANRGISRRRAR